MSGTAGPELPHFDGPEATSAKMACHCVMVGLTPECASTPQLPVLWELVRV